MANPQPDQFTKLSNEILDNIIQFRFNGTQLRIIMAVWRYTYGFNRKSAELSIRFLSGATSSPERLVRKELERLIECNVLYVVKEPTNISSRQIGFNKDYAQWTICTRGSISPEDQLVHSGEDQLIQGGEDQLVHSGEDQLVPQERKLKENNKENLKEKTVQAIFEHWNAQNIIVHRRLSDDIKKAINKALKDTPAADIIQGISHFEKALHDKDYELCNYVWGLDTFLKRDRGYKQFLDDGEKWLNYQQFKAEQIKASGPGNRASPAAPKARLPDRKQTYETFVPPD